MTIYRLTLRSFEPEPSSPRTHQYHFTGDPSKAQVIHLLKKDSHTALAFQDDLQSDFYKRLAILTKLHGLPSLLQMSHGRAQRAWDEDDRLVGSAVLEEVEVYEVT